MANFTPVGVDMVVRNAKQFSASINHVNDNVLDLSDQVEDLQKTMVTANKRGLDVFQGHMVDLTDAVLDNIKAIQDLANKGIDPLGSKTDKGAKKARSFGLALPLKAAKAFTSGLLRLTNTLANVGTFLLKAASMAGRFASSVGKAAVNAAMKLGKTVIGLGKQALGTAVSFESAFAGVEKTVNGLDETVEGFGHTWREELENRFREMSKTTPVALEELLKIGELGGQLGIGKEGIIEFTETISALGVSTSLTTEMAATQLARMANIMGTSTEDIGRMGASITALGNDSATTEPQILNFALRVAGAGKLAGLTEKDIFAIGSAMSSVGVTAEAGGTSVQKVLLEMTEAMAGTSEEFVNNTEAISGTEANIVKLNEDLLLAQMRYAELGDGVKASTKLAAQMKMDRLTQDIMEQEAALAGLISGHGQLAEGEGKLAQFAAVAGMEAEKFQEMWETDSIEAFTLFVEGLGMAGDEAIGILGDLGLEDSRLVRSFLSLGNAGGELRRQIDLSGVAWEQNVALTNEAAVRYKTFASQMTIFKNRTKDMLLTVGKPLKEFGAEALQEILPFMESFGERLPALMEKNVIPMLKRVFDVGMNVFKGFSEGFQAGGLKGGVEGIFGALGIPEETQTQIWSFIDNVQAGFELVKQKVSEAVVWLQENLPAGIAIAKTFWEEQLKPAIDLVIASFQEMSAFWAENGPSIQETAGNIFSKFSEITDWLATEILPWLIEKIEQVSIWFVENGPLMQETFSRLGEIVDEAWDVIKPALDGVLEILMSIADFIMNVLTGDWESAWQDIQDIAQSFLLAIDGIIIEFLDLITKTLGGESWQAVKDQWAGNWELFTIIMADWWAGVVETVKGWVEGAKQLGKDIVEGMKGGADSVGQAFVDTLTGMVSGAIDTVKRLLGIGSPSRVFAEFGMAMNEGLIQGVQDTESNVTQSQEEVVAKMVGAMANKLADASTQLEKALDGVYDLVRDDMKDVFEDFAEILDDDVIPMVELLLELFDEELIDAIKAGVKVIEKEFMKAGEKLYKFLRNDLGPGIERIIELLKSGLVQAAQSAASTIYGQLIPALSYLSSEIRGNVLVQAQGLANAFTQLSIASQGTATSFGALVGIMGPLATEFGNLSGSLGNLRSDLDPVIGRFDMMIIRVGGMVSRMQDLNTEISRFLKLLLLLPPAVPDYMGGPGTSSMNMGMGMQMVSSPAVSRTSNVSFGPITIQSGMEMSMFETRVRQIVRNEVRGF